MRSVTILMTLLVGTAFVSTSAIIINVPANQPNIQAGISVSSNGDTVLVQPGTYYENINFNGHSIVLGSLFLTTQDTGYISQTIIDGDSSGTVITLENGEDSTTTITGFTIQNGYAEDGGGIYCYQSTPTIIRNIISGNIAEPYGGGIYCLEANPLITDNNINGNTATGWEWWDEDWYPLGRGGGVYCYLSNPFIRDNYITSNSSNDQGGGVYLSSSNPVIKNNVINRNSSGVGGGIMCNNSNPLITNNTIVINYAWAGGGIYSNMPDSGQIEILNTILWGNVSRNGDGEMFAPENAVNITYCDIRGGWYGEGNIDIDPLLLAPEYNLCAQSPCLDGGTPDINDPDDTRSDIGIFCFEHPECFMGNVLYVASDGDDILGDGSPANPFGTIQHGIDVSLHGDSVIVQNGLYTENIICLKNIVLGSSYIFSEDTLDIQNTVINGDSISTVISFDICTSAELIGFTVINGKDRPYGGGIKCSFSDPMIMNNIINDNGGSGVYCYYSNPTIAFNIINHNINIAVNDCGGGIFCDYSDPVINNNTITYNEAGDDGGGIYCNYSDPVISDNNISNNAAGFGGGGISCRRYSNPIIDFNIINGNHLERNAARGAGIYCGDSNPVISRNTISENNAGDGEYSGGGGIYCVGSSPHINENLISGNFANWGAGIYMDRSLSIVTNNSFINNDGYGIYVISHNPTISNNIITGNSAGIWCNEGSYPSIINCTFSQNSGWGMRCSSTSHPTVSNSILWNNGNDEIFGSPIVLYSDIQGGWEGEGNIDIDPLFRDPENGDFHLMSTACGDSVDSPCIDMGHPELLDSLLDCSWGLGDLRSDMGAYGGGDGWVGVDEPIKVLPTIFMLSQNYPNPFNASTTIKYELPHQSQVTIEIYDILGRKVSTLVNKQQPAGYHQAIWRADDFSSGMYFYKLQVDDCIETRKMILMK